MSTVSSQGTSGRCNAKCYDAQGQICKCCCGGRNHGIGLEQAIENTNGQAAEMMKEWKGLHPNQAIIVENLLF